MKSYTKGILVGISIVLGSLLLMGYTSSEKEVGRYQISNTGVVKKKTASRSISRITKKIYQL